MTTLQNSTHVNTRDYKIVRSHAEVLRALGVPLQQAVKLLATKSVTL